MFRLMFLVLAVAATVFVSESGAAAPAPSGDYIVVLKDGVADPGAIAAKHAKDHGGQVKYVYKHALNGYAVTLSSDKLAALKANPLVEFVSEDREVNIAAKPGPCTDPFACQVLARPVQRIDAELSSTRSNNGRGSVNINVAVLDTGIDLDHPDLNVIGGVGCVTGTNTFDDDDSHGTVVAGFIAAKDNAFGTVGVAPGARLWAVKVLDKNGRGADSKVICGIEWVTSTRSDSDPSNDIAVANMSLGSAARHGDDGNCGLTDNDAFHVAICNSVAAGVTYVVSAGNDTSDFQDQAPAVYDEVLTTTSISDTDGKAGGTGGSFSAACGLPEDIDDTAATFSNFATLPTDRAHTIAAPGACVGSTLPGGTYGGGLSGTSFAAPHVAGVVALCIASGPCAGLTPAQIIQKVVADAAAYNNANPGYGFAGDPLRPVEGKYYGYLVRAALY